MNPKKQQTNIEKDKTAEGNERDKLRSEYLIQWRSGLWTQIRQKEDAIWRYISFYAAAIILAAGFVQPSDPSKAVITPIGIILTILILYIVTTWGILIVLDANYWNQRNLIFIGNIEREILPQSDMGVLLPKSYAYLDRFVYSRSYVIHLHVLFTTLTISLFAFRFFLGNSILPTSPNIPHLSLILVIIFVAFLLYIFRRDEEFVRDFANARKNAPGKGVDKLQANANITYSQTLLSSPLSTWGWSVALLCSETALYLILNLQTLYSPLVGFASKISSPFFLAVILFQGVRFFLVKSTLPNKETVMNIFHRIVSGLLTLTLIVCVAFLVFQLANGKIL
jgi:hypothetical protein